MTDRKHNAAALPGKAAPLPFRALAALAVLLALLAPAAPAQATAGAIENPAIQPQQAQYSNAGWDDRFGPAGVYPHTAVTEMALASGKLYVASGPRLLCWDGSAWTELPANANGAINALAASGSDLIVGGDFTQIGGISANRIARWDGSQWFALGDGMNSYVSALAVSGGTIYAGGGFTQAGTVSANYVARWDGTGWAALGVGLHNGIHNNNPVEVHALAASDGSLFAGGYFDTAGTVAVNSIARWDGGSWSALAGGLHSPTTAVADALLVAGGDLYVGGYFSTAGGVSASNIARWDGANWSALGSGTDRSVDALAVSGADLYAGGYFSTAGGVSASNIARWDGSSWSALGEGVNGDVQALMIGGAGLYAGGYFSTAGGMTANWIARWNSGAWSRLGRADGGIEGDNQPTVARLALFGGNVYAGGNFTRAGTLSVRDLVAWDGSRWACPAGMSCNDASGGIESYITALAASGDHLYAGYVSQLEDSAGSLYRWDGSAWSSLGFFALDEHFGGGGVEALAVGGGYVYAGGLFALTDSGPASNIARWDGAAWAEIGGGVDDKVDALALLGSDLYAAGRFTHAGGLAANHIARWKGTNWSALGGGLNGPVYALAVRGADLYVGGDFTQAGGINASNIARWDGTNWSALGSGTNGPVYALAVSGDHLFSGGDFTQAGGIYASNIARWDGASWVALGSGLNGPAYSLAAQGGELYVGGTFTVAGGKDSLRFAIWHTIAVPFSDVHFADYYFAPVQALAARGAISGYDGTPPCPPGQAPCFLPFASATRAQTLKIILIAHGIPLITPPSATFSDVPVGSPFFSVVETAVVRGIVGGYGDGSFRPNNPITRGQLSKVVALAFGWDLLDPPTATFGDVPRGSPFFSFVETAAQHNIISGYDCGAGCREFRPGNDALRGQIAKIVYSATLAGASEGAKGTK